MKLDTSPREIGLLHLLMLVLLCVAGCGGGGSSTPDPLAPVRIKIEGIRPSQHLSADEPGYAGDELTIEVLSSGPAPESVVWNFGGGAIPFGDDVVRQQVELGLPGDYVGQVTASAEGHTDTFTFPYRIVPEVDRLIGIRPSAPAGFVTKPVRFTAEVDGEIEFATWTFLGSGAMPSLVTDVSPVVQLGEPGEHQVRLQVTIKDGPTITKTFPFTVVANPWQARFQVPNLRFHRSRVFSDGGLGVLFIDEGERQDSQDLTLLLSKPDQVDQPEMWSRHDFGGTRRNHGDPLLVEHQGHLGIGTIEVEQFPTGNKQRPVLWTASTLHPTEPADWTRSVVGWTHEASSIGLAGNPAGGWLMAIGAEQLAFWGATNVATPASDDWVIGPLESGPWPRFQLVTFEDALILCNSRDFATTLQIGRPANFQALLADTGHELPLNVQELQSSDDRLIAMIEDGPTSDLTIAHADRVPLSVSDWTFTEQHLDASQIDQHQVFVTGATLYVASRHNFLVEHSLEALRLRSRPVLDPTASWTSEIVKVEDWGLHFVIPTAEGDPYVGWQEANNDRMLVLARRNRP